MATTPFSRNGAGRLTTRDMRGVRRETNVYALIVRESSSVGRQTSQERQSGQPPELTIDRDGCVFGPLTAIARAEAGLVYPPDTEDHDWLTRTLDRDIRERALRLVESEKDSIRGTTARAYR